MRRGAVSEEEEGARDIDVHAASVLTIPYPQSEGDACWPAGAGAEEDSRRISEWREGMRALARLPNVYVKASMLEYMRKGWQHGGEALVTVKGLVREVRPRRQRTPSQPQPGAGRRLLSWGGAKEKDQQTEAIRT